MKKELLELLRDECIKRNFKEYSTEFGIVNIGMCRIAYLMMIDRIITVQEKHILTAYLKENKPNDANIHPWYSLDEIGNQKRIEFLNQKISEL